MLNSENLFASKHDSVSNNDYFFTLHVISHFQAFCSILKKRPGRLPNVLFCTPCEFKLLDWRRLQPQRAIWMSRSAKKITFRHIWFTSSHKHIFWVVATLVQSSCVRMHWNQSISVCNDHAWLSWWVNELMMSQSPNTSSSRSHFSNLYSDHSAHC